MVSKRRILIFILMIITMFLVILLLEYLLALNDIPLPRKRVYFDGSSKEFFAENLSLIVFAPILEEFMYQYGLKFSVRGATLLVLGVLYTIYLFVQPNDIDFHNPIILALFWGFMILAFMVIFYVIKNNRKWIEDVYKNKFRYIFIISVIAFAYSHISLYEADNFLKTFLWSPVFLFTYIIAGIIYGIIRIKVSCFGHLWPIFCGIYLFQY